MAMCRLIQTGLSEWHAYVIFYTFSCDSRDKLGDHKWPASLDKRRIAKGSVHNLLDNQRDNRQT